MLVTAEARRARPAAAWTPAACVAAGLAVLLARPVIASTVGWSSGVVVAVFALVLALGLAPASTAVRSAFVGTRVTPLVTLAAGASVFVTGRLVQSGHPAVRATLTLVCLNTLAAIAEEALFRRVAFDVLLPAGALVAISGSALLFGLAHVTVYGWWAFPLDTAAGAVLGWQRWASGGWLAPAATHALADLLAVI